MKAKILSYVVIGAVVSVALVAVVAQEKMRARAMFVSKKADGLEVKIINEKGQLIDPGKSFKAGERIKISFDSNFDGYVYFVNVTPGGVTKVIYSNEVKSDESYQLPSQPYAIEFDKEPGTEILKVILSHQKIKSYEDALKNSDGELGKSATSVAEELADNSSTKGRKKDGKNPGDAVGIVASPCQRERGLVLASGQEARCRSLVLASGNQSKNEGSVVAISDKNGTKLKEGEIAVFEMRLKHI